MNFQAKGYSTVTPYLIVDGASAAVEFYKSIFNAVEILRLPGPDGKIGHCEIKIGDSMIMLADESIERGALSPKSVGGSPVCIMVYVPDVDAVVEKAVKAGAKTTREVADQFYGDRSGGFSDPFGHLWYVATHVKDVSPEEMEKAAGVMVTA